MPRILHRPPELPRESGELIDAIAAELGREPGAAESGTTAPIVLEEESTRWIPGPPWMAVTVFWDDPRWRDVDIVDRSRIILKAYEQVRSEDVERITRAAGFTFREARKLGIAIPGEESE